MKSSWHSLFQHSGVSACLIVSKNTFFYLSKYEIKLKGKKENLKKDKEKKENEKIQIILQWKKIILAGYLAGYPVSGQAGYPVSGQISIRYNPRNRILSIT